MKEQIVHHSSNPPTPQPEEANTASLVAPVFGRHINRRDLMRIAGGVTALAFMPQFVRTAGAQESTPAAGAGQMFNPSEELPTEASGELNLALVFDATSLDPMATYTLSNAKWEG